MINKKSSHVVFSKMRILSFVSVKVEKKCGYGYLKEIVVRRSDQNLYKFKEGGFPNLHLNDIEDMLLLLTQNRPQRRCPGMSAKELYTLNFDPQGVIYEDKQNRKRLMRVNELHKFPDETLQLIYKTLLHRLQNFRLRYNTNSDMLIREWTEKDQKRTRYVLRKIDDQLLRRRTVRSLEVLVGGRNTETNIRLLQRTI
ncbi:hypothetical protein Tco_1100325 [Tanacetum coccineum]